MVGGVRSILLITLSNICCSCSVSFFVIVHVSAAYSIVGMMHVSTSFQIVFISSWLKSLLPAMLNMVSSAASIDKPRPLPERENQFHLQNGPS